MLSQQYALLFVVTDSFLHLKFVMTVLKTQMDVLQIVLQAFLDGIVPQVQRQPLVFAQQLAGMDLKEAQRIVMT